LFSAIAQSAAAFVALIAVFTVFRLQLGYNLANEIYSKIRYFLIFKIHLNDRAIEKAGKKDLKEHLSLFINQNRAEKEEGQRLLDEIEKAEKEIDDIALKTSFPMKMWGIIFFCSIFTLAISESLLLIGNILAIICVGYIYLTLLKTKVFIQECLKAKQ